MGVRGEGDGQKKSRVLQEPNDGVVAKEADHGILNNGICGKRGKGPRKLSLR